ncbi:MAG TPA: double zinc ribbon domain-containing protein, partial [Alphaproteobacteria bacterium]|nr:double zinc ribbon domain-containing protein [Alphaproteobacteria bacterium]
MTFSYYACPTSESQVPMSLPQSTPRWRKLAGKTLDLLLPPLCLACDAPVGENRTLCPACWSSIHFITPPVCACCGAPFDIP